MLLLRHVANDCNSCHYWTLGVSFWRCLVHISMGLSFWPLTLLCTRVFSMPVFSVSNRGYLCWIPDEWGTQQTDPCSSHPPCFLQLLIVRINGNVEFHWRLGMKTGTKWHWYLLISKSSLYQNHGPRVHPLVTLDQHCNDQGKGVRLEQNFRLF